jgi:hypothetical protein
MLGVKSTWLNAAVRTTNRKQELEMLVTELTRARSSNIPPALFERARRATELILHEHAGIEMVCVLCARKSLLSGDWPRSRKCRVLFDVLGLATLRHVLPLLPASTYIPTPELECRAGDSRAKTELGFASSVEAEASSASCCHIGCVRECVAPQPTASTALHSPHVRNVPLICINITVGLGALCAVYCYSFMVQAKARLQTSARPTKPASSLWLGRPSLHFRSMTSAPE